MKKDTIPSMAHLPKPFETIEDATDFAMKESKRLKRVLYVVQSVKDNKQVFYVDPSGFIRSWETLLCEYDNGFLI